MASPDLHDVEVVYARPDRQWVVVVPFREGITALDALEASGLRRECPELRGGDLPLGIFGRRIEPARRLSRGDRVEIYRELRCDPREARRRAVEAERQRGRRPGRPPAGRDRR
jgi:putative ubiquitin-RnfH superfamily antitoxin RatB of RatAB toxin-antitoxin module